MVTMLHVTFYIIKYKISIIYSNQLKNDNLLFGLPIRLLNYKFI